MLSTFDCCKIFTTDFTSFSSDFPECADVSWWMSVSLSKILAILSSNDTDLAAARVLASSVKFAPMLLITSLNNLLTCSL